MNRKLLSQLCAGLFTLFAMGCSTRGVTPAAIPTYPLETATLVPQTAAPVAPTAVQIPQSPAQVPPANTSAPPTEEPSQPPDLTHRIGVRVINGTGEFFDRLTGEKFMPRGFNYVRLAPMSATSPGLWHSTLNPGLYEPERAEAALQAMQEAGYNIVRVFVDCCRAGNNAGDPRGGVSQAYLDNVIDFLNKAKASEIFVLLVLDLTPAQGGYDEMWAYCCTTFDGENLRYLTTGGHTGERRFDRDFIGALIEQNAPMDAVFAFDLTNEVHFNVDKPPFSLSSGKVTTANQKTYDMANPDDKQRMMDENLVYWIDQMRANILEVDPTALVTVSFPAINTGNTTVNTGPAIVESTADFIDLHTYMGWGLDFEEYMRRFGVDGPTEKPLILGEFGAERRAYPSAEAAARKLVEWQALSCQYGFDGWLMWTWDGEEQDTLWHGLSENGEISAALSPKLRGDPCHPAVKFVQEMPQILPAVVADYTNVPAAVVRSGWTSYSSGNGVRDLALDQEGNLWAATSGGAVVWRSDGTYTKYTWEHGLAGNTVYTVAAAPDGAVWFGTYGGVSRFDGNTWQTYSNIDGLASDYVISSAAAADGTLWFGTLWSGILRFDGETWTTYGYLKTPGFEAAGAAIDIAVGPDGTVWATGYDGIMHFDGKDWKLFNDEEGMLPDSRYHVLAVSEGDLWASIASSIEIGLVRFDGETWQNYTVPGSRIPGEIQAIAVSQDGTAWISTRDIILSFDGEIWRTLRLPGVTAMLPKTDGELWFGTVSQGILTLTGQTAISLITDDHLDPYGVRSITTTPAGDLWFGGLGGVAHLDGESWQSYTVQDGLADDNVYAVAAAADGTVWVGTENGASRLVNGQWTTFTISNSGLPHNEVRSIAIDQLGAVWFATLGGVSRFDGEIWETFTTADGLVNDRVFSTVVDEGGAAWFGTDDGVSRFDGQTWKSYTGEDGLWNITADSLAISPDGTVWIGRINGLAYLDGEEWISIPTPDGLDSPEVGSISFTADGSLWCSLSSISNHPSYGAGLYDGKDWKVFSAADGLGQADVYAIAMGIDGSVWFGTPAGASRLLPSQ